MDRMLLDYLSQQAWLLEEQTLAKLVSVVERHSSGVKLEGFEIAAISASAPQRNIEIGERGYQIIDGVAVIPIDGILAKHSYMVNGISQPRGTSTLAVQRAVEAAADDAAVRAILLDVYSPGGSVEGVAECADAVYQASQSKTVWAQANDLMASGAYFIASQAEKIFVTQMGIVGSIGAYTVITDSSGMAEKLGLKIHVVKRGDLKATAVPGSEVTDDQLQAAQIVIDDITGVFVSTVARGRGVSASTAEKWADGAVHLGKSAVTLGLADGVQSFDTTLSQLIQASGGQPRSSTRKPAMARAKPNTQSTGKVSAPQAEGTKPAGQEEEEEEEEQQMPMHNTTTAAAAAPDVAGSIKAERERSAAILAAFPDDPAFAQKAIAEGWSVKEAKAEHYDTVKAKAPPQQTQAASRGVAPINTAAKSGQAAEATDDFWGIVAQHEAKGMKRHEAVRKAQRENPEAHAAMLKEHNTTHGRAYAASQL